MDVTIEDIKDFIEGNLDEVRDIMNLLAEYSDQPKTQEIVKAVPRLVSAFTPLLDGLRKFAVQQDIDSIRQFEHAGLTTEQAIMLVVRQPGITAALLSGTVKQISNRRGK